MQSFARCVCERERERRRVRAQHRVCVCVCVCVCSRVLKCVYIRGGHRLIFLI